MQIYICIRPYGWQGEEMVFGTASARELLSWIGGLEHAVGHKVTSVKESVRQIAPPKRLHVST